MTIRRAPTRRGFSLVEVLMAVLVLSIGLLGLGAVFPMIVRQQRIATQETMGLSAREGIKQFLANHEDFGPDGAAWALLRAELVNEEPDGDWWPVEVDRDNSNLYLPIGTDDQVVLPLSQRLYPLPMVSGNEPRFVWDLVARLVDPTDPDNTPILVAVFIRPLDPGIRVPIVNGQRVSLTTTLLNPRNVIAGRDMKLPISRSRDGRPLFDGTKGRQGLYSLPVVADVALPGTNNRDDLMSLDDVLSANADYAVANTLISSVGQRFLDRDGNLYEVRHVTVERGGITRLEIEPAFSRFYPMPVDEDRVNPIIFVPQGTRIEPFIFEVQP